MCHPDPPTVTESSTVSEQFELGRIRGEYLEMPGLCPTQCQAQRLWGLPCERCEALLAALIEDGFLIRTGDGQLTLVRAGADCGSRNRRTGAMEGV